MSKQNLSAVGVPALLAIGMFVAMQVFADILSTKIVFIPFLKLAVDGGTILFPLLFTVRDFVHKTLGKINARRVIVIAACLNLLMAFLFWFVGILPADASWEFQEAYEVILMPVTQIVIASIFAMVVSQFVNTEIFSRVYKKLGEKKDVLAVMISNAGALLIDSVLFSTIAFIGVLPWEVIIQIMIANILIKGVITLFSAPLIKLVPRTANWDEI